MQTSLVTRNVRIGAKRTSVRLEPELWKALERIAAEENTDINEICTRVAATKGVIGGFTSALRVYIVCYWSGITPAMVQQPKRVRAEQVDVQRLSA